MAYTESKAYDLRNVQYKGTRIGGTDQIATSPIQYQGTPVTYVKYKNTNIMHRYVVRTGDYYDEEYTFHGDYYDDELAGTYSVSSTSKSKKDINTNVPGPEPYSLNLIYDYYITKYELTRTSGTKNENKYYLYAFTIILYAGINGHSKYRTDKYDYLSTEDISLDTLAAKIEDPSGGTEGFTPPYDLGISTESILENTRRERERTDDVERSGDFNTFSDHYDDSEGTTSSWGPEFDYGYYNGIFNQGAEDLTVDYYEYSSYGSQLTTFGNGRLFNFDRVVNSKSEIDLDHVYISGYFYTGDHSSCTIDNFMDYRHTVYVTDDYNELRSSKDFEHFPLIFLMCSSCSNHALGNGSDKMVLTYYREDATIVHANITYDNSIIYREY